MRQGTRAGFHLEETVGKMMLRNRACGRFGAPHRLLATRLSFHSRLPRLLQHNASKAKARGGQSPSALPGKAKRKKKLEIRAGRAGALATRCPQTLAWEVGHSRFGDNVIRRHQGLIPAKHKPSSCLHSPFSSSSAGGPFCLAAGGRRQPEQHSPHPSSRPREHFRRHRAYLHPSASPAI